MSGAEAEDDWAAQSDSKIAEIKRRYEAPVDTDALSAAELIEIAMEESAYIERDVPFFKRRLTLLKAAEAKGSVEAIQRAGDFFSDVTGEYADALELYTRAADAGNTVAMRRIGDLYLHGRVGAGVDVAKAIEWYKRGMQKDCTLCMMKYGCLLSKGVGVAKDEAEGDGLILRTLQGDMAGHSGDNDARFRWHKQAADKGYLPAIVKLGRCYYEGLGVAKDEKKGADYYYEAGEKGDADGNFRLGCCFANGVGEDQDYKQAAARFAMAASRKDAEAIFYLGRLYYRGQGVEADANQALRLFLEASELGCEEATNALKVIESELEAQEAEENASKTKGSEKPRTKKAKRVRKLFRRS